MCLCGGSVIAVIGDGGGGGGEGESGGRFDLKEDGTKMLSVP